MTLFSFDSQEPLDHSDLVEAISNAAKNDNVQPINDIDQTEKNVPTAASETISVLTVRNRFGGQTL